MVYCPIYEAARAKPKNVAVYSDEGRLTYEELDHLIDQALDELEIFYADATIDSFVRFFSLIRRGKVPLPISKREPFLPSVDTSNLDKRVGSLLCTSGTMGAPKIAMHAIENHIYSATHLHEDMKIMESDSLYLSLPLNHVGGIAILFRAFSANASVIIGDIHKKFATHISFVPTQLKRFLLGGNRLYYRRLKCVLIGGAPIPKRLCDWAVDRNLPLYITYGMTETASQLATARYDKRFGVHFGKPLEGREVRIASDGEIWVKGKTLFLGYLNHKARFQDGWYKTGDLGRIGRYGLEVIGRKDRMIVSGGENIYLDELESAFMQIPQVLSAIISKRNCDEFGQRPTADLRLSAALEVSDIVSILQKVMPKYKIPDAKDIHIHQ